MPLVTALGCHYEARSRTLSIAQSDPIVRGVVLDEPSVVGIVGPGVGRADYDRGRSREAAQSP